VLIIHVVHTAEDLGCEQLDELRQTVADLSMKIEVLSETIRKGKIDLITN
jgi:hypothetical protein